MVGKTNVTNDIGQNHRKEIMMKSMTTRTVKTLGLALAAIVSLGAWRSAEAGVIRTPFEGVESFVAPVSDGQTWVTDGILHIRDAQQLWHNDASDPRLAGDATITFNVNFHLASDPVIFGYGPQWGTVQIQNEGGSWSGAWVGMRTRQGHTFIHGVMKGEGGYDGLYSSINLVKLTPDLTAPLDFTGTIIETPCYGRGNCRGGVSLHR